MVRQSALENATEIYMRNSYWKKEYDTAPSELCRQYIRLGWYRSLYGASGTVLKMKTLENQFCIEDWEHLLSYTATNPFRTKCRERIQALKDKER